MIGRVSFLVLIIFCGAFMLPNAAMAACSCAIYIQQGGTLAECDSISFEYSCAVVAGACNYQVTYSVSSTCADCKPITISDFCRPSVTTELNNCSTSEETSWPTLDCPGNCTIEFTIHMTRKMTYIAICADIGVVAMDPMSGAVSTAVTINGFGFSTTPANNTVTFNGTTATVNSATSTQLVAVVPNGATTGPVTVTVGSDTSNDDFTFTVTE